MILLDVKLNDMYGVTVLRHLRAAGVRVPIVLATGCYFEIEVEADARAHGAAGFLHKPFLDLAEVAAVLRAVVADAADGMGANPSTFHGIVAVGPLMREVVAWIERYAPGR